MASNRSTPEWGTAIFSPLCVLMRPTTGEELGAFLKYTLALVHLHVQLSKAVRPGEQGLGMGGAGHLHAGCQRGPRLRS